MFECITDKLNIQAEFFEVSHFVLWDFVAMVEKSRFFYVFFLVMILPRNKLVEFLRFQILVHEKSGYEEQNLQDHVNSKAFERSNWLIGLNFFSH